MWNILQKKPRTVPAIDRKWFAYSTRRWTQVFDAFLCDVDLEDSQEQINRLLQRAADSADEALRVQEQRWGRYMVEAED